MGTVLFRAGEYADAEAVIRDSMKEGACQVLRCHYLGMTLHQSGRTEEAKPWFDMVAHWLSEAKRDAPPQKGDGRNLRTCSHSLELTRLQRDVERDYRD